MKPLSLLLDLIQLLEPILRQLISVIRLRPGLEVLLLYKSLVNVASAIARDLRLRDVPA